ncbi:MAG TPA: hypothetical protein VEY51_09550, partial [Chondromyces sp.]|nr:hypothetical protein [Chondromyces sp.]
MLVDINLLPEKKRKRLPVLVPVLFVLLLVSGGMGAFLWGQAQKNELELAESRLKSAVQLRETLETNINKSKDNEEDIKVLMNAIQWAEGRRIEMVPVLEHLVSLLPERGFFLEFSYTNHETIILLVQFDTSRQAA